MKGKLAQQQDMRQQQRLTPLQVQFVRMLEMTGPEIEAEVKRTLDDMPALEVASPPAAETAEPVANDDSFNESAEQVQLADYKGDDIPAYLLDARNHSSDDVWHEPVAVNDELSLFETLDAQLGELDLSPRQLMTARYIAGNLDDSGYLTRNLTDIAGDIASQQSIEVSDNEMRQAWKTVRALDPAGVAAVDLRDCLLLQLSRRPADPLTDLATEIVRHYFDLFSKKHYTRLADILGVSNQKLREALDIITRLNPKPGNLHGDSIFERSSRQIIPEFIVEPDGDRLNVTLLNNIPELTISETFAADPDVDGVPPRQKAEALAFVRSRRDEAANFIKTIAMRQTTLYNVMVAIAKLQRDFFMTGDETLIRPMILKDVAAITGYDLSVISRATATKYVMTVAGLYPLKFFFNERPNTDDDTTFLQIAEALRRIIAEEDKDSPLSDEAITARLQQMGFSPARRTVAKYRERLGIPVARLRRIP